jgi:chaperonin cofactor prefoldin
MTDDILRDMVITHDKKLDKVDMHLESLAVSVDTLANNIQASSRKMEDFTTMLSQQNLLMEKFANMDKELGDSFKRVHDRVDKIENIQDDKGCVALLNHHGHVELLAEKIIVANKRIDKLEQRKTCPIEAHLNSLKGTTERVENLEDSLKWITRLTIGGLVSGAIGTMFMILRG